MSGKMPVIFLHFADDEKVLMNTNEFLSAHGVRCISVLGIDPLNEVLGIINPDIVILPLDGFLSNIPTDFESANRLFSKSQFIIIGQDDSIQSSVFRSLLSRPNILVQDRLDYPFLLQQLKRSQAEKKSVRRQAGKQAIESRIQNMRADFVKSVFQRSLKSIYYCTQVAPDLPSDNNMELVVRNWHTIAGTAHIFNLNDLADKCKSLESEAEAIYESANVTPAELSRHYQNAISFVKGFYTDKTTIIQS